MLSCICVGLLSLAAAPAAAARVRELPHGGNVQAGFLTPCFAHVTRSTHVTRAAARAAEALPRVVAQAVVEGYQGDAGPGRALQGVGLHGDENAHKYPRCPRCQLIDCIRDVCVGRCHFHGQVMQCQPKPLTLPEAEEDTAAGTPVEEYTIDIAAAAR